MDGLLAQTARPTWRRSQRLTSETNHVIPAQTWLHSKKQINVDKTEA